MSTLNDPLSTDGGLGRRWSILPGTDLLWHPGDDTSLVYDLLSGDTHLLDNLSAMLLDTLSSQPLSEAELLAAVVDDWSLDSQGAAEAVSQRLHNLRQLDLIYLTDS